MPEVRLIDANALIDKLDIMISKSLLADTAVHYALIRELVAEQPTIEAEPVRRVRWTDNGEDKFICSACKGYVYRWFGKSDFCPRCGADMRDGGADNG